ncbi:hypothetical protein WK91_18515 [Burkholderia cepacia]|uniref:hypothetical protein n=1 Tax=Burkholderia cepacia TaxID=292 RepID=UPI0007539483|nr:hypothetical protein [Burkholderia cepacia]KVW15430.1 hypothetical protein WK91_18515 [Burkholderia cepacia]
MQQVQIPPLAEGEVYVCSVGDRRGELTHLILLPGDNERASQPDQQKWAEEIKGGDLPTLAEHALMREHCPEEFKDAAYWSKRNDGDGFAWCTHFSYGYQYCYHEGLKFRARRVRRFKG